MIANHLVVFALIVLSFASNAYAQGTSYSQYQHTPKNVTQLEWRLLQVQLPLSAHKAYMSFDESQRVFNLEAWITTLTLSQIDGPMLREEFKSTLDLASALLTLHIPEYKTRNARDLRGRLILGRSERDVLAVFDGTQIKFTEAYYAYLKEIGRR